MGIIGILGLLVVKRRTFSADSSQLSTTSLLQVGTMTQHLGALEAEYEALRDEFRAVTDDLEAMVKENQVCKGE